MMRRFYSSFCAIGLVFFLGCASNPKYKFQPEQPQAKLENLGFGSVDMCVDGKYYDLPALKKGDDALLIPAGKRVTLRKWLYFSGYNVSYSCGPKLSFIPQAGETYYVNGEVAGRGCQIELVRADGQKETGVAVESTVGPVSCFPKN